LTQLKLEDLNILKTISRRDEKIFYVDEASTLNILNSVIGERCYTPHGRFIYLYEDGTCVAIDNTKFEAFTEDFDSEEVAIEWLYDENFDTEAYLSEMKKKEGVN